MTIQELLGQYDGAVKQEVAKQNQHVMSNTLVADALKIRRSVYSLLHNQVLEEADGIKRMDDTIREHEEATVLIEAKCELSIDQMIQEGVHNDRSWNDIAKQVGITAEEMTTLRNSFAWQHAALRAMPDLTMDECPTEEWYDLALKYGVLNPKGLE